MADNYLPGLNVDPRFITLTGFSSGSAFGMNVHIGLSGTFKGAHLNGGAPRNDLPCSE